MTRIAFVLVLGAAASVAGCTGAASAPSTPLISLDSTTGLNPVVEVSGISGSDRAALAKARLTEEEWSSVLRVSVVASGTAPLPVSGRYVVDDDVRFIPAFPLDPGRRYEVTLDPAKVTRLSLPHIAPVTTLVSIAAVERTPSTIVTAVYPSGAVIPANQLRMYVQFSAPMGLQGGLEHIMLLDDTGREMVDAMLPLDTELWSSDRTRYTAFFDPGRVKRKILPNRSMGRPLREGETITLVVKADWRDAHGVPLRQEFRRDYRVGRPDERPLDPDAWRIASPAAGTRDPLTITFPEPLDHGLLRRSIAVSLAERQVEGELQVGAAETSWSFVPRDAWVSGAYAIMVQPILEDLAGNRIGRAFEVLSVGDAVPPEDSRPTALRFQVKGR